MGSGIDKHHPWFSSHFLNYFDHFGNIKLGCIEVTANCVDLCEKSTAALQNSQAVFISKLTADHMMELDNTTLYDVLEIPMNTRRSDVVISMYALNLLLGYFLLNDATVT